jgi:hypothetical protein
MPSLPLIRKNDIGALASVAFSRVSWPWALSAVAAQLLWIVVYRKRQRNYTVDERRDW